MAERLHLSIPEPCHENWNQMTPNEQGRHCLSCQKTVVDFTLMSDQEVLKYILTASSSVCGRFNDDQVNRTFREQKLKPSFTWKYVWQIMVTGFLLLGQSVTAQSRNVKGKVAIEEVQKPDTRQVVDRRTVDTVSPLLKKDEVVIVVGAIRTAPVKKEKLNPIVSRHGVVLDDSTWLPIANASIQIKGSETGLSADEQGNFRIAVNRKDKKIVLMVSAVGYAAREIIVPVNGVDRLELLLQRETEELPAVEVMAGNRMGKVSICGARVGGLTVTREVNRLEKVKRNVNDWLFGTKEVTVYPNPVVPGSIVNINIQIKKTGDHKLELMDAGGRVVYVQALQVTAEKQVVSITTASTWARGVYWLRMTGNGKKTYQTKVVLQ